MGFLSFILCEKPMKLPPFSEHYLFFYLNHLMPQAFIQSRCELFLVSLLANSLATEFYFIADCCVSNGKAPSVEPLSWVPRDLPTPGPLTLGWWVSTRPPPTPLASKRSPARCAS